MDQTNIFKPEYKEIAEKEDRKTFFNSFQSFQNIGYHFRRDRSIKGITKMKKTNNFGGNINNYPVRNPV